MVSSKKTGPPAQRPQATERKQRGRTDRSAMFPVAPGTVEMPADYADWLTDIKTRIHRERLRVVLASNAAMVLLYWDIGQSIIDKQTAQGYGTRVIDRLAADLRDAFTFWPCKSKPAPACAMARRRTTSPPPCRRKTRTWPPANPSSPQTTHRLTNLKSRISSVQQCQNGLIGQQSAVQLPR